MTHYSVAEAKNNLPKLLDRMLAGEEVVITRRGRAVARVAPIDVAPEPQPRTDLDRLRSIRAAASTGIEPVVDTVGAMRDEYRY